MQARRKPFHRQCAEASRRQLECQRKAVELAAYP